MKDRNRQLYLLAWIAYITFSMLAFPFLRITVMLFSIPLTMLGGWYYRYKGALATTALTIPYHSLMLYVYARDPSFFVEALNPFGIGSQLLFSYCTALLKILKDRYQKLNDELELIVAERTDDLRQLAEHLINMEYIDRSVVTSGLLDDPFKLLESMMEVSDLLYRQLENQKHPAANNAKIIHRHIQQCKEQLTELLDESETGIESSATLRENIQKVSDKMMHLGGGRLNIDLEGEWQIPDHETSLQVLNIISEAISNAVRHAHASNITIGCIRNHDTTTITVENNGDAFPSQLREGMGLPLMRYRAMSIGGSLTIAGGRDQLTRVICTIPHRATTTEKAFPLDGQRLNTPA